MRKAMWLAGAAMCVLGGCDDNAMSGGATGSTTTAAPTPTPAATATPTPTPTATTAAISSLGADGWASAAGGTTGGDGATAAKTYTVTNRNELLQALYGGTAVIAADGSVTGTLDPSKKIIYVAGTISLNVDKSLTELTADSYVKGSCAAATYNFQTEAALNTAYYAAYRPSVWGTATLPSGTPENARVCAANLQKKVVMLSVPSNTSIIGVGATAKITHGNLIMGSSSAPVDNIVVRNLTMEDSFDFFPQWDPTDSTTGRWNSAYDMISVLYATHVWIDHSTFSDGTRLDKLYPSVWTETYKGTDYTGSDFKVQHHDGIVDVTKLGNYVTISNSLFFDHDKSFLIGGTDTASTTAENPTVLKVTFHDNYFRGLKQRQPRVRFGMVHTYNNLYEGTLDANASYTFLVAWTAGQSGKFYAENNAFVIAGNAGVNNLWGTSISTARTQGCITAGYTAAQCATTFFDSGTLLNGNAVDVKTAVAASNAAVSASSAWKPSDFYTYSLRDAAPLYLTIPGTAGVGKL